MVHAVRFLYFGWIVATIFPAIVTGNPGDDIESHLEETGEPKDDEIFQDPEDFDDLQGPNYTDCKDLRDACERWGQEGLCENRARYMHPHCPRTCNVCRTRTIEVPESHAFSRPRRIKNIVSVVGSDLGKGQFIHEFPNRIRQRVQDARVSQRVNDARTYIQDTVMVDPRYNKVRDLCRNRDGNCALWATRGYCNKAYNAEFMKKNCAPVCFSCEELHPEAKCPLDPNAKNALYPGDLNRLFERLTTDPAFEQYSPKVLSRPSFVGDDTEETVDYQLGPWVLTFDDFFSVEEAERMIQVGFDIGYERSSARFDDDSLEDDELSNDRTSSTAWCHDEVCASEPLLKSVTDRIETVLQIPYNNSEYLQLLKYEEGEFYQEHHDYISNEKFRMQGVRILTVFLYLNAVEEGGGTHFPLLDLTVEPKQGRVLIWPSVLDESPHDMDDRTEHEALAVIKGQKFGSNAWIHMRDMKTPSNLECQ